MTKSQSSRRKATQQRSTNWGLIGGLALAGVLLFGGLIVLALQAREPAARPSLAAFCAENPESCIVSGAADAPVSLVEVSDFGCPNCANFHNQTAPLIQEQYVEPGQVRWVFVPYALRPETVLAATASMCAAEQDRYEDFVKAMFQVPDDAVRVTEESFTQVAQSIGLDMGEFQSCVDSDRFVPVVNDNRQIASDAGVNGTPTFFANDNEIVGARPFAVFQREIEAALSGS